MKRILFQAAIIPALLFFFINIKAGDTLKINITSKHTLTIKGELTGQEVVIDQLFFTPDNHKLREIYYDEKTGQISGYIFYFYRDDRLFTEEFHNTHDSLLYILKHDYDKDGRDVMLTRLVPVNGKLSMDQKTLKTFAANQKIVQIKVTYGKKPGVVTKYTYNPAGLLLTEKSTYKPIAKLPLKQVNKVYSYLPSGDKIDSVLITETGVDGNITRFKEVYEYNENGLLLSVRQYAGSNALKLEKKYFYNKFNTIIRYDEYDGEGKLTLQMHYEYKKHFMEKGTQTSHYENL